ncbi:LPS export ABC transporter periplasmic protein LptC [Persephonella sp.]
MRSKIISYTVVFFILVMVFSQVSQIFEKTKLKNVNYKKGEIYNFTLSGVNSDRYILKGKSIIQEGENFIINSFNLEYIKNGENIFIHSDKGIYDEGKDILNLEGNVRIVSENLSIETELLKILVKERRAFNTKPVKMYSGSMETLGNNIFINLREEMLKLENVRTIYRGS